MLYFFCFNVAFSKPEMYYCIEEGSTGFQADGKGGYKHKNWDTMKFKAKIDFDKRTFESDDMWTYAECSFESKGFMHCTDTLRSRAIYITDVSSKAIEPDKLYFSYAAMGNLLNYSDRTQMKISYGKRKVKTTCS